MGPVIFAALVFAACFAIWVFRYPPPKNLDIPLVDAVEEAAFAVIEASLEAEPQVWRVVWKEGIAKEIVNDRNGVRINLTSVFVQITAGQKTFTPPSRVAGRIYQAAMKLVKPKLEAKKIEEMDTLVSVFRELDDRSDHDAKAI